MEKTLYIEIEACNRHFYEGACESLILPTIDGEYGVLCGHEPVVMAVNAGEARLKVDGQWKKAFLGEGFAEILPTGVILLVDTAEWEEEIDIRRAEEAMARAKERMRQKQSVFEYHNSKADLARAIARLHVRRH